jgi:DNA-binding NarL/FixJ family response regulator
MAKYRVLLGLSSISKNIALKSLLMHESDIEIVSQADNALDILLGITNHRAEVVVIDLPSSGKDSGLCSHILAEFPEVKILAVSEGGNRIVIYEMAMLRREESDTSLENLAHFIRKSVNYIDNGWVRIAG